MVFLYFSEQTLIPSEVQHLWRISQANWPKLTDVSEDDNTFTFRVK